MSLAGLIEEVPTQLENVWSWWRGQMPVAERWAYFDHAAVAPLSGPAAETLRRFATSASQDGDVPWLQWSAAVGTLRDQTAELTGCDREEVVLVPNTTAGINLVAEGFPWKKGDNVIVPEGEFPSNLFPWLNQSVKGVEVRVVPRRDGVVDVESLLDRIDDSTRIIAVSWVGYASGFRVDLEKLVTEAHAQGVLVFLDAIQGLGLYPLDLQRCDVDFLAADGHKWLLGPEGAGVAVIRRRHWDRLRPTAVGWASVQQAHQFSDAPFTLRTDAARFEGGSTNMPGMMSLSASLEMFLAVRRVHGEAAVAERIASRADELKRRLTSGGATMRFGPWSDPMHESGIVTFDVPGCSPADFRQRAMDQGVVVSCRGGGVRASVHVYNSDEDLERLAGLV